MNRQFPSRSHFLLLLLIVLLGFALRLYDLGGQSMWSDEGLSLYRAQQPLVQVLTNSIIIDGIEGRDTNPPFYFLVLHGWRALVGDRPLFLLRFVGLAAAILSVPLMFRIGTAVANPTTGLLAAFLFALSPFHVWQSQVLRNYSLLITFNLVSVYALIRIISLPPDRQLSQRRHWLTIWVAASILGIATHYFGFFIFAFNLLVLSVFILRQWGQRFFRQRRIVLGLIISAILTLPLALVALERFRAGQQVDFRYVPLADLVHHAVSAFSVGMSPTLLHPWPLIFPALVLFLGGFVALWRKRRAMAWLLLGYQLVPLFLLQILSLINPLYNGTRHLLIGLPPFLLLMAAATVFVLPRRSRWIAWFLVVAVVAVQGRQLAEQFSSPDYIRDDLRGVAELLNRVASTEDIIIVHDAIAGFVFDYYYEGDAPWQSLPRYGQLQPDAVLRELAELGKSAERIWFISQPEPRNGFPRGALPDWLEDNWPVFMEQRFDHIWLPVKLEGYVPNPLQTNLPLETDSLDAVFVNGLALRGVKFPATVKAGESVWWPLYWEKYGTIEQNYTVSLRFLGPDGQQWAQVDGLLWPQYSPRHWPENVLVAQEQQVSLPDGLPPGNYLVSLRLVDRAGKDVQTVDGRVDVPLGEVVALSSDALSKVPAFTSQEANLGPVQLLGYALPALELRPGHLLQMTAFWQVRRAPQEDYILRLRLVNGAGEQLQEALGPPTRADYPSSQWQVNEILQGQIGLIVPGTAVPDDIFLQLALLTPGGDLVGREITLENEPKIVPWPLVTEVPPVSVPLNVNFGAPMPVKLHGYNLSAMDTLAGETLELTLVWQALADIDVNYVVFAHVANMDETIVAQGDGVPVNGTRLTLSWRAEEVLSDTHTITLPPDTPPGTYELWVGFYDPDTFARPPVFVDGVEQADGRLLLTRITVMETE